MVLLSLHCLVLSLCMLILLCKIMFLCVMLLLSMLLLFCMLLLLCMLLFLPMQLLCMLFLLCMLLFIFMLLLCMLLLLIMLLLCMLQLFPCLGHFPFYAGYSDLGSKAEKDKSRRTIFLSSEKQMVFLKTKILPFPEDEAIVIYSWYCVLGVHLE